MSALMKKVCMYCKVVITEGPAYPESHGVCDVCAPRLWAAMTADGIAEEAA